MKKISASIIINLDPHEIYFFASDPLNFPFWMDVKKAELISGNGGVGSVYELTVKRLAGESKIQIEIVQKSSHERFVYKNLSSKILVETGVEFTPEGTGKTKVTLFQQADVGIVASFLTLNFITVRDSEIQFRKMLKRLKIVLENEASLNPNTRVKHNI